MSITYEEFVSCALHLEKISNSLQDGWKICHVCEDKPEIIYLKKVKFTSSAEKNIKVLWEYHIIYSNSYSVPVLYVNACYNNGKLLSLEKLEEFVDPIFKEQFTENKWNVLTQQEHPFTRTPFFMLHPCGTEDFMSSTANTKVNPLISWLSSIGPMVNLKLDLRYGLAEYESVSK